MKEADWEIASHGLKWIDYRDYTEADERAHIAEAIRIHTEVTGARPLGIYTGRSSVNTIKLAAEEGGFVYCSDAYADDLPYWIDGPRGPFLIIPYTLDANDMRFATPQGFNSGDQFFAYLKDGFDYLYAEGESGRAEDDVGRPALPPGRPAGPGRGAGALPRLRRGRRRRSGCRGASTSPGTGTPTTSRADVAARLGRRGFEKRSTIAGSASRSRRVAFVERHQRRADVAPAVVAVARREHRLDRRDQTAALHRLADRVGVVLARSASGSRQLPR